MKNKKSVCRNLNQLHNIKNLLKSRIYEQITKYLTADDSVVHNNNANDMLSCLVVAKQKAPRQTDTGSKVKFFIFQTSKLY
jgi:hypothetical protein